MSLVTRKSVFGVCDQVRLKQAFSATETSYGLEISAIASKDIILSRQRTNKGADQTSRMRRLAWTFAARIGYKYQIRLTRSRLQSS